MRRIIIAGLIGGIIIFVWNFASWMALPWHTQSLRTLPEGEALIDRMQAEKAPSGVYHFPGIGETEDEMQASIEFLRTRPHVTMLVYVDHGTEPLAPATFVITLLVNVLAAVIAAALLKMAGATLPRYGKRVLFIFALGIFATLATEVPAWLWWSWPPLFGLVTVGDVLVGWLLAGLGMAAIVRLDPSVIPA